jgi:tripartite-type tricarboxylate transporter receptor subunit TctC
MNLPRRRFLQLAGAAAALSTHSGSANAQTFPARPITIVVPFAAGGPIDALVRVTAESMRGTLGQPLIIENASGAAGNIGVGRVARAAPDGYTLVTGFWGTHVVNGAIYKLPYDVVNDFEPILLMSRNAQIIVARTYSFTGCCLRMNGRFAPIVLQKSKIERRQKSRKS